MTLSGLQSSIHYPMLSVYDSIIFLLFQDKLSQTVKESLKEEGQCLGELYIDCQALPKGRVPGTNLCESK